MLPGHAAFTYVPDLDYGPITRQPELMSYDALSAGRSVSPDYDQETIVVGIVLLSQQYAS